MDLSLRAVYLRIPKACSLGYTLVMILSKSRRHTLIHQLILYSIVMVNPSIPQLLH